MRGPAARRDGAGRADRRRGSPARVGDRDQDREPAHKPAGTRLPGPARRAQGRRRARPPGPSARESGSRTHEARRDQPYLLYLVGTRKWQKFGVGDQPRVREHARGGAEVVQVLRAPFAQVTFASYQPSMGLTGTKFMTRSSASAGCVSPGSTIRSAGAAPWWRSWFKIGGVSPSCTRSAARPGTYSRWEVSTRTQGHHDTAAGWPAAGWERRCSGPGH